MSDLESGADAEAKAELRVWLRLLTCVNLIEREVRGELREHFDTTLPRFDLLAQLDRVPEGLTMSELSGRLMVSNGNITGLAERLVQEGLVMREASAADRRTLRLRLTPEGRDAFERMVPVHAGVVERMMEGLSRPEVAQLLSLLGRLKSSLAGYKTDKEEEAA